MDLILVSTILLAAVIFLLVGVRNKWKNSQKNGCCGTCDCPTRKKELQKKKNS